MAQIRTILNVCCTFGIVSLAQPPGSWSYMARSSDMVVAHRYCQLQRFYTIPHSTPVPSPLAQVPGLWYQVEGLIDRVHGYWTWRSLGRSALKVRYYNHWLPRVLGPSPGAILAPPVNHSRRPIVERLAVPRIEPGAICDVRWPMTNRRSTITWNFRGWARAPASVMTSKSRWGVHDR